MSKKIQKKEILVNIQKLQTNYELRYDYFPMLNEFLKQFPREHVRSKKQSVITPMGEAKDEWSKVVSEIKMGEIIAFLLDNNIDFVFQNVPPEAIKRLQDEFADRQRRISEAIRLKHEQLDVSNENFDFLKIQPYNFQKKAVKFFEINNGVAILGDQPGVGKALKNSELVFTKNGPIKIGDITIGEQIFSQDGNLHTVTGVYPQGVVDCYRVVFNDDSFVECNLDHIWVVRDSNRRKRNLGWTKKTLKQIVEQGWEYNNPTKREESNRKPALKWEIPLTLPVNYQKKEFVIDPYILGALIGDGCLVLDKITISIPNSQFEIKDIITSRLPLGFKLKLNNFPKCPQYFFTRNTCVGNNIIKSEIKRLKLNVKSHEKFIPSEYLYASIDQRTELLRGLMDTDGSANKNRIQYHTTSLELAKNVVELVQSLGGQALIKKYDRRPENKPIEYRVNVRTKICPFHLSEKKNNWNIVKTNYCSRYIKSVEFIGKEQQVCITINSKDNTFLTTNYIVTHNSLPAMAYAKKHKLKTLIICPASLKLQWRKEIMRFTGEKAFVYKFFPKKKTGLTPFKKEESLFHITNFESLDTYLKLEYKHKCKSKMLKADGLQGDCGWEQIDLTKSYKKCPRCENIGNVKSRIQGLVGFQDKFGHELDPDDYDLVIIDECHRIKESKTTWTKVIHKAFKNVSKRILISGTVIKNRPFEFFSSLNFINPEEWKNSHEFGIRYGAGYQTNFGWDYSGASNLEELYTRISPYFLRRLKKDVLKELPPKTYINIPIELTDQEYKEYQKLEKELKKVIVEGKEKEIQETYLTKIHKLKKFTSKIKLEHVKDMIQDIIEGGEKVVVVSEYIEIAKAIFEHFGEDICVIHTGEMSDVEKQVAVEKFQENPKIKIFSGMIIASGVGITLTAASKLIKIGFSWSPSDEEQIDDRIHRASSTAENIEIIRLVCQETIDEIIEELLDEKSYVTTKVMDNKEYKRDESVYDENIFKQLLNKLKTQIV